MAVLDPKKTYRNLKKKGFQDAVNRSSDHKYLEFYHDEVLVLYTKISHGSKEIGNYLIKQMSDQCKLNKKDFMDLANCPLDIDGYIDKLQELKLIVVKE